MRVGVGCVLVQKRQRVEGAACHASTHAASGLAIKLTNSTETFGLGSSLLGGVLLRPLVLVVLCWGEFRGGRGGFRAG